MKTTWKSIIAILVPLVAVVILSSLTDLLMLAAGAMTMEPFSANPAGIILLVIFYRTVYNVAGCYFAAKLAPSKPMRHALILGAIGFVLGIIGAVVMWDVPPHWYPLTLVVLALPAAWLGGKLYLNKTGKV